METAAFIASAVSIGIAVFAVWLAITFYKMATKVSEGIKDAEKNISSGVDRLEACPFYFFLSGHRRKTEPLLVWYIGSGGKKKTREY